MSRTAPIRFKAKLLRPASTGKASTWNFLLLPAEASAKLPSRGMTTVEGTINGHAFQAALEPDGEGSHWLKVSSALRKAARLEVGQLVALEIAPGADDLEPALPPPLRKALAASAQAQAVWTALTPAARRDWVHWINSAKQAETRARRISNACEMLASGKRRVCCFDRSGRFSRSLSAPKAVE